jgi:hypothetical protein
MEDREVIDAPGSTDEPAADLTAEAGSPAG